MTKQSKQNGVSGSAAAPSTLTEAAAALDGELRRYFDLAAAAQKMPLNSEKNLERAARAMQEAMVAQEGVAVYVRALFDAITGAREAQAASAEALAAHAQLMATRANELGELLQKFAALGVEAKELSAMMQQTTAYKGDPYGKDEERDKQIGEVCARMDQVVANAEALTELAAAKGMTDVERQADGLRQQIHAARNKLSLLQKSTARS